MKHREKVIILILSLVYVVLQWKNLRLDLWNDEIYTLKHFVFVPFSRIVSDYHVPNNHVFFSLVTKVYLSLFGVSSVDDLLERPALLRVLPLLFSAGTLLYVYRFAIRFFNKHVALMGILLLITTLPYFNFCLQVRGYMLSTLLLTATLYHTFSYRSTQRKFHLPISALTAALAIYTIPSNVYFVAAMLVMGLSLGVRELVVMHNLRSIWRHATRSRWLTGLLPLMAGILLAGLLYIPIWDAVISNDYVAAGTTTYRSGFQAFIRSTVYLFSGRELLLVPAVLSLAFIFRRKSGQNNILYFLYLLGVYLIPFAISILRKDNAPDRVFTNLIPVFALALAAWLWMILRHVVKRPRYFYLQIALIAFCALTYRQGRSLIREHLLEDIRQGRRSQDLYYNYYLAHYRPLVTTRRFASRDYDHSSTVLLDGADPLDDDIPNYLKRYHIPFVMLAKADSVLALQPPQVYIICKYPLLLQEEMQLRYPQYRFELLYPQELSYHNFVRFSRVGR